MFRKLLWLVFAIGISGTFIYGFEVYLMVDYMIFMSGLVETLQISSSEVQDKVDPIFGGIMTGASFAAKGFFALLGIKVANLFFGK